MFLSIRISFLFGLLGFVLQGTVIGQQSIDGTINFQTDPQKAYSIYIPSAYDENQPNKLMIGLHPWNTNRWNAQSWRDTLVAFAEVNQLILLCPDGGADGQVDDPIDTAFTSAILDSIKIWYNINPEKVFAMGFSWGGLTTYTYGLFHGDQFAGLLPVGAAINGASPLSSVLAAANEKPIYIVHGSRDSPGKRFFPVLNALQNSGAILNDTLLTGVGHTIDFVNRNEILTSAYKWLDSVSTALTTETTETMNFPYTIFPNPVKLGTSMTIRSGRKPMTLEWLHTNGGFIRRDKWQSGYTVRIDHSGVYIVKLFFENGESVSEKVLVID